ncbi:GNAT family N-acetyltransferase [Paenibacillus xanthanilyticus]|uniref:GNAT family N-acetyltransferase n=1 Tax=Paenibacillus xanthanilyticus TaxID=1783531 RepID=A0ABV8K338_9BACL
MMGNGQSFYLQDLEWDTDYFGVKTSKLVLSGELNENDTQLVIENLKSHDFIVIANNQNNYKNNYWISRNTTAFLVDMNIQFIKKIDRQILVTRNNDDVVLFEDDEEVKAEIKKIAAQSFQFSRFFNDPYLPRNKSHRVYEEWINNSFGATNKKNLYIKCDNEVAGFLLFSFNSELIITIELIAISSKFQGRKLGQILMHELEKFSLKLGSSELRVGTQIDNSPAVNFYARNGFQYTGCHSIYHYWPNK